MKWLFIFLFIFLPLTSVAQEGSVEQQNYVADIELQTSEEFLNLLSRAEQLMLAGASDAGKDPKVSFVLHGPVLTHLLRENYLENKKLVDLAASLSAMDVIEVKACRTWMGSHGLTEQQLQPFIETVAYGVAEVRTLLVEKNYVNF